mmetsp:Transcript_112960/g.205331  ORF Transcript_112960/g.205331 Transcript_112960/m.205331 type:complete len:185 (+) Transcript_112960:195-749(+)
MLIPLPSPPRGNARSGQCPMMIILILQTILVVFRMVLFLDIIGGFIMGIIAALGWYAWKDDMNITIMSYWGMMCVFYGVFDVVKLIHYRVNSHVPWFSEKLGFQHNFGSAVMMLIPISELLAALLAWRIYKSWSEGDDTDMDFGFPATAQPDRRPPASGGGSMLGGRGRNFQTFQGAGQRLGSA